LRTLKNSNQIRVWIWIENELNLFEFHSTHDYDIINMRLHELTVGCYRKNLNAQSSRATWSVRLLLLLETKSSRATRSLCHLLLLLETRSSKATWSLGHLLLLLKSQSSRTPRGKGRVLLRLKRKTTRTPLGKCHLLLLKTFICCIHLQSNQSSHPTLIELLHNSRFMRLLRAVRLV
jgi:hypothetical protein